MSSNEFNYNVKNPFNYINLSFFSNKMTRSLLDYKKTEVKSPELLSTFSILEQLSEKYVHWTVLPKYNALINDLLNTGDENELITQSLIEWNGQKYDEEDLERIAKLQIVPKLLKEEKNVKLAGRLTQEVKSSIDSLVNFSSILSDFSVVAFETNQVPINKFNRVYVRL